MTSTQESSESLSQLSSDDLCKQIQHPTLCKSVHECECVKNVVGTLIFYEKNKHELTEDVLADYFLHRCKSLINDYHHILTQHLGGDTKTNTIQFQLIHRQISEYIKCDINKCQQYKRTQTNEKMLLNQALNEDSPIAAWIEFTDTIHCYFVHSFDVGYRISAQDQQLIRHNNLNEDEISDEGSGFDVTEIKYLRRFLEDKRQKFSTTIVSTKFSKFSTGEAQYVSSDRRLTVQKSNIRQIAHNFGNRFYYWPYFKTNDIPDPWNPGYTYAELYIPTRYDNLKDEILFNETRPLQILIYNSLKQKSLMLLRQANSIKSMKCDATRFESTYNIKKGSSVSIAHIIALLLHVNYLNLSSVTGETNSVLKKRNSQFGHSFRLLRETVECFSSHTNNTNIELYRGISGRNTQHNSLPMLCQPTSTSRQVEVASLFSEKNGIIIKLSKYSDNLKYFDCSFLSCHGNESEYLVMQSEYESVVNIQDFKLGLKMMLLSEALLMFDHIFSSYAQNIHHTIPQHLQTFMVRILHHYLSKYDKSYKKCQLNEYAENMINAFFRNKTKLKINVVAMKEKCNVVYQVLFFDSKCVRIDLLCILFLNLEYLEIQTVNLCEVVIEHILEHFQQNKSILKYILLNVRKDSDFIGSAVIGNYQQRFREAQFTLMSMNHDSTLCIERVSNMLEWH